MRAKMNRYGTFFNASWPIKNHIFYERKRMKKLALFCRTLKKYFLNSLPSKSHFAIAYHFEALVREIDVSALVRMLLDYFEALVREIDVPKSIRLFEHSENNLT
jgi:hypothetical protein